MGLFIGLLIALGIFFVIFVLLLFLSCENDLYPFKKMNKKEMDECYKRENLYKVDKNKKN